MKRPAQALFFLVLLVLHLPTFVVLAAFYVDIPGALMWIFLAPLLQLAALTLALIGILASRRLRRNVFVWLISLIGIAAGVFLNFNIPGFPKF